MADCQFQERDIVKVKDTLLEHRPVQELVVVGTAPHRAVYGCPIRKNGSLARMLRSFWPDSSLVRVEKVGRFEGDISEGIKLYQVETTQHTDKRTAWEKIMWFDLPEPEIIEVRVKFLDPMRFSYGYGGYFAEWLTPKDLTDTIQRTQRAGYYDPHLDTIFGYHRSVGQDKTAMSLVEYRNDKLRFNTILMMAVLSSFEKQLPVSWRGSTHRMLNDYRISLHEAVCAEDRGFWESNCIWHHRTKEPIPELGDPEMCIVKDTDDLRHAVSMVLSCSLARYRVACFLDPELYGQHHKQDVEKSNDATA